MQLQAIQLVLALYCSIIILFMKYFNSQDGAKNQICYYILKSNCSLCIKKLKSNCLIEFQRSSVRWATYSWSEGHIVSLLYLGMHFLALGYTKKWSFSAKFNALWDCDSEMYYNLFYIYFRILKLYLSKFSLASLKRKLLHISTLQSGSQLVDTNIYHVFLIST